MIAIIDFFSLYPIPKTDISLLKLSLPINFPVEGLILSYKEEIICN